MTIKLTFEENFDKEIFKEKELESLLNGDQVTLRGKFFIKELKNKNNDPYILAKLSSGEGQIIQFIWNNLPIYDYIKNNLRDGELVELQALIEKGRDSLNMDIKNITILNTGLSVPNEEMLKDKLREKINNIKTPFLKSLVVDILNNPQVSQNMFLSPATKKTSYNYKGGVAHLIIDTMDLSENIATALNSEENFLDVDLLSTCAFISNIGRLLTLKIEEGIIVKTNQGQLGNSSICSRDILSKSIKNVLEKRYHYRQAF